MLKSFLHILFLGLSISLFASNGNYSVIKLDALGLMSSEPRLLRIGVERAISPKYSATFSGEFGMYNNKTYQVAQNDPNNISGNDHVNYYIRGGGVMGEFRYYPFRRYADCPLGTFFGMHGRAKSVIEVYEENIDIELFNVTTYGFLIDFGAHVGYKLNSDQFTLETLIGLGYPFGSFSEPNRRHLIPVIFTEELKGIPSFLRMEIHIGYAFPEFNMKKKKRDYVIG